MENRSFLLVAVLSIVVLFGWLLFTTDTIWHIRANSPRIIGGYGDHFAYDGIDTRPFEGALDLYLNMSLSTGTLTVTLRTTDASGPLKLSSDTSLEGRIKLVSQIVRSDRVEEEIPVYGDTGTGGPELPRTRAVLAGWSRFDLFVEEGIQRPANHHLDDLIFGGGLGRQLAHIFTIPQHRDAVADMPDLVQPVGDKNDADAVPLKFTHDGEKGLDLGITQG